MEWALLKKGLAPVCGIDEAGRGPLAGPVVAAAVLLNAHDLPDGIADSKKLSAAARAHLCKELHRRAHVGVGQATAAEIDALNIHHATLLAMRRAFDDLCAALERAGAPCAPAFALVDGKFTPDLPCGAQAVVKGDAKVLSIAAASIIAKQHRDVLMMELDERFPGYGFARHKGYPTKIHLQALERLGPCPEHRRGYAPVRRVCEGG